MPKIVAGFALATALIPAAAIASGPAPDQTMLVVRNGEQPSINGPATSFVGSARIDPLFPARAPSRVSAGYVNFQPGARSMWHTHPLGQTLVVTAGTGWVQQAGGKKQLIKPGDVIWTPPGVKHWHGATATTGMTHMAIQESLDGKNVEWLEPVSEAQYEAAE
ncbi:TPA: cupin domain-containing protein [Pseudomonas putida]|nr:cupin domain-containing protein [Pseudomonas putida]HEN8716269.1 cupin domain-containing protein [Pseudomonas putida]